MPDIALGDEGRPRGRSALVNGNNLASAGTPGRAQGHISLPLGDDLFNDGLDQGFFLQANTHAWHPDGLAQDDLFQRLLDEPAAQTGLADYDLDWMSWNGMPG
jgi:hypothetical protein